LIPAQDKDGGEKDAKKHIVFWKEQGDKNTNSNPEHNKTNGFFHKNTVRSARFLIVNICKAGFDMHSVQIKTNFYFIFTEYRV
jgi:hypothetical protein